MPLLKRKRVLAAKVETTIGTAETLAGTDGAFNIYNPVIQAGIDMESREGEGGFGYLSSVPGARMGTATFRTNLEWDGTATPPAWATTFLPACGWVNSTGTFSPTSEAPGTNVKTLTIAVYSDGVRKILAGCMGSFVMTLPTGRAGYIDWTFNGVWQAPTDVALLTPTYPTVPPMRFAGVAATWNSVGLCVENTTITSGNNVIMRECPVTAAGFISALVTDRKPTINTNPEAVTVAAQDRWGEWLSQTEYALSLGLIGPDAGTLTISAPKAQILNDQEGDRNMLVTDEIEFGCNKNGATHDQELTFAFAAAP